MVSIGTRPGLGFSFHVDRVFPADASQDDVFAAVLPVLGECLKGFDVTVFAYGMTGSGKTHTISGSCHGPGLLSRAVQHIFGSLQATAEDDQVSMVFLSYIELYNNMLFDLLSSQTLDETNGTHLKLREHPARGVVVSGSSSLRMPVGSAEEVARLISRGDRLRATSSTLMNDRSSRSHAVIILDIKSKSFAGDSGTEVVKTSRVNLVDLAGSERLKLSGAEGSVRDETCHINKALTCLGDVLNALSRHSLDTRSPALRCLGHVPYRDSKLTMLLKSSLGGHAKTIMLATIRSSSVYFQQSLITLRYAARARHIQNVPIRNISNTTGSEADSRMDTKLTEIRQLRLQLSLRDKECERLGGLLEKASTTNNEQNELEGCMMREEFEKRINVLQSKNVEDHLKLKEELKLLIIKKTSVQSLLQSSEAKVSEMMKRHSLFLVQKEKADLTNAELHRKLREGQLLIKSLQEKNAEWKRAYQVALLNQAAVVIENDTDCSVQDKIICEAKCQHLAQELQELRCASEDSLAAVADLHRHVTDVIMPICCSDSPECSAHGTLTLLFLNIASLTIVNCAYIIILLCLPHVRFF